MDATVFNLTEEGEAIPHKPTNPPRQMARICWMQSEQERRARYYQLLRADLSPPRAQVKAASCAGHWDGGYDLHVYSYFHVQSGQLSEVDEGIIPNNGTLALFCPPFPAGA